VGRKNHLGGGNRGRERKDRKAHRVNSGAPRGKSPAPVVMRSGRAPTGGKRKGRPPTEGKKAGRKQGWKERGPTLTIKCVTGSRRPEPLPPIGAMQADSAIEIKKNGVRRRIAIKGHARARGASGVPARCSKSVQSQVLRGRIAVKGGLD